MKRLSDYLEYAVTAQAPARRWTALSSAAHAVYVYDTLGALSGWAMLLGRTATNQWEIISRKGV